MATRLNLSAVSNRGALGAGSEIGAPQLQPKALPGTFGMLQGPGMITFTLNGLPCWIVDVKRFAGTPVLNVTSDPQTQTTRIALQNARFPGTQLSADFVCQVGKTEALGTTGEFTFTLGGFHAQIVLEYWLAGLATMQSQVTVSDDVCILGALSRLRLSGIGTASFAPNWLITINGPDIATISGIGSVLNTSHLDLRLLSPTDPTISAHPKSKRTLLSLTAGTNTWDLPLEVTDLPIGTLKATAGLFTQIEIETGEGTAGDTSRELLASSTSANQLVLAVAGGITDLDGKPLSLALSAPTYAIAFDASADHTHGNETVLLARFAAAPTWLVIDGFAFLVGDSAAATGLKVQTLQRQVTSLRCEPALFLAAAPMASGPGNTLATKPVVMSGAVLPLVAAPGATPGWGIVAGPTVPGQRRISLPNFKVSVVRREDLLALDFSFDNLALEAGGGNPPQLVSQNRTQPSYLMAQFDSPQNIAEQAYFEQTPNTYPTHPPPPPNGDPQSLPTSLTEEKPGSTSDFPLVAQTRAAGPSRLAFRLPAGVSSLPYSLPDLLNWVNLEQSVVPVAEAPDANQTGVPQPTPPDPLPAIKEPESTETAIEAPWRLILSPNYSGAWSHSATPVTLSNRTELWHTRLAVRKQLPGGQHIADETIPRRLRAVWSPDFDDGAIPGHFKPNDPIDPDPKKPDAPFRMSLDPNDRVQIVHLSSNFKLSTGAGTYVPTSIPTDKLYLTTLGAWIDLFGNWSDLPFVGPSQLSVQQWQHRAAMGRDNYVRVVYAGFLLPFGNAASLVKITERKFQSINNGPTTAYLRQRFFVIVREPVKFYTSLTDQQQRHLPFQSIQITTLVTPDVVPQLDKAPGQTEHYYAFFPTNGPNTFLFHIIGTDWEGQTSEFTAPLYFVEQSTDAVYQYAVGEYNNSGTGTRDFSGQKVAFAHPNKPGDTTFHASKLTFKAQLDNSSTTSLSPFYPEMEGAEVVVPSIQQLSGGSGALSVTYYQPYITNGMNVGEVFLQNAKPPLLVQFNGKQSGGVATPNLTVSGLSRKFGTVSGPKPDDVANGTFKASDIFSDDSATLFGFIKLGDLIDNALNLPSALPILTTDRSLPTQITTKLEFRPTVKSEYSALNNFIVLTFNGSLDQALFLQATIVTPLQGGDPQVTIHGELNNFTLALAKAIGITINQIAFDAPAGQKLSVTASMPPNSGDGPIQFLGDLSFLNELRKFIPADGFQDPPSLDVTPEGITAGYTLPIPNISVGAFSLENVSLSAGLTLPFFPPNPLRFRFAFSEREHPFLISVSLLGGGGFFGIAVGPDGVEILEAALEFGANVSIDLVVASGNVHIMAGIYLRYDLTSTSSQLTGYLRAGGSLDVLGLISASVEFYLGFTYYFGPPCKIAGEATITIEIDILFFSASVSATLRREFGDPVVSFADLIAFDDWEHYCDAFAA